MDFYWGVDLFWACMGIAAVLLALAVLVIAVGKTLYLLRRGDAPSTD